MLSLSTRLLLVNNDKMLASDWLPTGSVCLVSGHNIVISDDSQETTSHLLPQHQHWPTTSIIRGQYVTREPRGPFTQTGEDVCILYRVQHSLLMWLASSYLHHPRCKRLSRHQKGFMLINQTRFIQLSPFLWCKCWEKMNIFRPLPKRESVCLETGVSLTCLK